MSDTWNDIQALKSKRQSLREKHSRRKKELEGLLVGITGASASDAASKSSSSASPVPVGFSSKDSSKNLPDDAIKPKVVKLHAQLLAEVEKRLLVILCDLTLNLPVEAPNLTNNVSKALKQDVPLSSVENLLQKLAAQQHISISYKEDDTDLKSKVLIVTSVDHAKLSAVTDLEGPRDEETSSKRKADQGDSGRLVKAQKLENPPPEDSVESLLSMHSAKEKENKKLNEEILQLLSAPSAKEQYLAEKFKSQGGAQLQEFCQYGTREECKKVNMTQYACEKLHFRKIINKHTDESLGDCSFLNTCFHMDTCKYVHYEIDYPAGYFSRHRNQATRKQEDKDETTVLFPQQWIQCDLRTFDMSVLGKFSVIMADPPWDIHMELPYGTMSDDEMRRLDVPSLQDDGYIFLWVTGRAMELARECLRLWGYDRIDELIWVKTNQLQRIIRTGRTGHWLNHGKEHCLVGAKGKPKNVNVGLDCDVIVAEVRATSHKPDEIYGIIERLCPGTRKIELFGRPHNVQPNWITLGNQLDGVKLLDPEVVKAFKQRYPDGNHMPQ